MRGSVLLPDGSHIYPRGSVDLGGGVVVYVERWFLWIETPAGWYVASADSMLRDAVDGIYFDSFANYQAEAW